MTDQYHDKGYIKNKLHRIFTPVFHKAMRRLFKPSEEVIQEKLKLGWDQKLVQDIYNVFNKFFEENLIVSDDLSKDRPQTRVIETSKTLLEYFCIWADQERHWFPRWWLEIVEKGQEQGIFDPEKIRGIIDKQYQ